MWGGEVGAYGGEGEGRQGHMVGRIMLGAAQEGGRSWNRHMLAGLRGGGVIQNESTSSFTLRRDSARYRSDIG